MLKSSPMTKDEVIGAILVGSTLLFILLFLHYAVSQIPPLPH